jgi:protein-S-isoprenylcysteine O-methyltransferase Ste14
MKDSTKGWLYVAVQFALAGIIIISSYIEGGNVDYGMQFLHWIGIVLLAIGGIIILFAVFNFGQVITPNPIPLDENKLRTGGLYKYVRHPMYFSVLILLIGVVFYFGAVLSLVWIAAAFMFLSRKSNFEERFLVKKFPEYSSYRTRTKKLIPFIY